MEKGTSQKGRENWHKIEKKYSEQKKKFPVAAFAVK